MLPRVLFLGLGLLLSCTMLDGVIGAVRREIGTNSPTYSPTEQSTDSPTEQVTDPPTEQGTDPPTEQGTDSPTVQDEPSASTLLHRFGFTTDETEQIEALELMIEHAKQAGLEIPAESARILCDSFKVPDGECEDSHHKLYRSMDGSCNNWEFPERGRANSPLLRLVPSAYEDGISRPRGVNENGVSELPNPRDISIKVMTKAEKEGNDPSGSMLTAIFGQFLDHDVTHVPLFELSCEPRECNASTAQFPGACVAISLKDDDPIYKGKETCMDLPRSIGSLGTDCTESGGSGVREHINTITAFVDASQVYGSSEKKNEELRSKVDENLKATFRMFDPLTLPNYDGPEELRPYLPQDEENHECRNEGDGLACGFAGDERAPEQPTLTALHTIFVRYHNQVARKLRELKCTLSEDQIHHEARKIVTGVYQHIVYNEYLPALLGPVSTHLYKLEIKPGREQVPDYKPNLDPTIVNGFASAAFRLGHSQIPSHLETRANDNSLLESFQLIDVFFSALAVHDHERNGINGLVLGNIHQRLNKIDRHFAEAIHGNLFHEHDKGFGLDLIAMNIQRGRDHGIPPYVVYREHCWSDKPQIESWADLEGIFQSKDILEKLREVYGEDGVRNIDPFVGFMLEKHVPGGRVGHTLACILGDQFKRLRLGDRFWYERDTQEGFTKDQLTAIKSMTMSRVICDTLDKSDTLRVQPYAFHVPDCDEFKFKNKQTWADFSMTHDFPTTDGSLGLGDFSNHLVSCNDFSQIPGLDLSAWKEDCTKDIDSADLLSDTKVLTSNINDLSLDTV